MSHRSLTGCVVNLSISSAAPASPGYPPAQVNRLILQFVSALVGQGAGVAFGHDWRDDGIMESVHGYALRAQGMFLATASDDRGRRPLLWNALPWPDQPKLTPAEREQLQHSLRITQAGLPEELSDLANTAPQDPGTIPLGQYLRARGLTHLRHQLTAECHARICLGGPEKAQGRYPGIVEEALLGLRARKPVYLSRLLGGVASQLVTALEGGPRPENFAALTVAGNHFNHPPVRERSNATKEDREYDPAAVWRFFQELGLDGLSQINFLSADENYELFSTPVVDRAIELTLTGISRCWADFNRGQRPTARF